MLSLKSGGHVVYINVPDWGQCASARVTGNYLWRWVDNDFNHRFPVDPNSVYAFDRNDAMVAPALRERLKLRGRCYRIQMEEEFERLVDALRHGVESAPRTLGDSPHDLSDEMKPSLAAVTEKIRNKHTNAHLGRLVEQVFRRVPWVRSVTRQGGAGDPGAALVVELELGSISQLVQTLVVKVTSCQGTLSDALVVSDNCRALGAYDADMVLIVSPAISWDPTVERELDRLREDTMKPVALLAG